MRHVVSALSETWSVYIPINAYLLRNLDSGIFVLERRIYNSPIGLVHIWLQQQPWCPQVYPLPYHAWSFSLYKCLFIFWSVTLLGGYMAPLLTVINSQRCRSNWKCLIFPSSSIFTGFYFSSKGLCGLSFWESLSSSNIFVQWVSAVGYKCTKKLVMTSWSSRCVPCGQKHLADKGFDDRSSRRVMWLLDIGPRIYPHSYEFRTKEPQKA